MNNPHLTARYGLIHGSYWMVFAAVSGYVSLYLLELGFSSGQVGVLIAAAGILSAVLQPLTAAYADRPGSLSLKTINLLVAALSAVSGGMLLLVRDSRVLTLLFYGLTLALLQLSTPLVNSLGVTSINCGCQLNYGVSKSVSSVTFALASFLLGRLTAGFGGKVVPWAIVIFYGLFLGSLALYPCQRAQQRSGSGQNGGLLGFARRYPGFMGVLGGCVLLFVSHIFLNNFTLQIIRTKGGGSSEMGVAMAIAALSELPTMLCFSSLLKRKGSWFWMRLTGVFFALKVLGSLLCRSVAGFYVIQLTQMFAWSIIAVASVYYINAVMAPEDAVKGQAMYTMAYTLGSVLGALLGGWMIDALGVNAMLIFGTAAAALGTGIVCRFTEKKKDKV